MPYGKIDDDLHSHPKFQVVGPVVSWAHIRAISWSNAHGTDGFIPDKVAAGFLSRKDRGTISTSQLPGKAPLWDRVAGGYMIHDFFDENRNRPAEWWEELAAKRAASGRAGGLANGQANAQASARPNAQAKSKPVPRTPVPVSTLPVAKATSSSRSAEQASVVRIFARWAERHSQAKLTEERRRKVLARLREGYTEADILDAVAGIALSPYHMGENETGTVYDDLELICRSGSKVEKFRDYARNGGDDKRLAELEAEVERQEAWA